MFRFVLLVVVRDNMEGSIFLQSAPLVVVLVQPLSLITAISMALTPLK